MLYLLATNIIIAGMKGHPAVSAHYARLRAALERQGIPIGSNDTWIAAHALALGAVIVTDNVGEFARVPGLSDRQ